MVNKKIFGIAMLGAALLSACSNEQPITDPEPVDGETVELHIESVGMFVPSRAGAYNDTKFAPGMSFGFVVTGANATPLNENCTNVKATLGENGKWTLDREVKIKKGQDVWVRAYYPYAEKYDWITVFPDVKEDVMVSDLCVPSATGGLKMLFSHIYADINFEIVRDESYTDDAVVSFVSLINGQKVNANDNVTGEPANGLVLLSYLTLPEGDNPYSPIWGDPVEAIECSFNNTALPVDEKLTRSCMVSPVNAAYSTEKDQVLMSLYVDDRSYDLKAWCPTWKAGYRYTYIIRLAKNPVTGDVTITVEDGDITISPWVPGGSEEITMQ